MEDAIKFVAAESAAVTVATVLGPQATVSVSWSQIIYKYFSIQFLGLLFIYGSSTNFTVE